MKINRAVSAEENVFLLIEEANPGIDLNSTNVTLGTPIAYDGSATDDDTRITVTAIPGHGFTGSHEVTYNRLTLEEAMGSAEQPNFVNLSATEATEILSELCEAFGLVVDGGLLVTDENGAAVANPTDGDVKMALIDVVSSALLYNERPEPFPVVLGNLGDAVVAVNPAGTTVNSLDLFAALGSPTSAGIFVYINRGTLVPNASGTPTYGVHLSAAFPAGSKVYLVNEGAIYGHTASAMAGPNSMVRGALSSGGFTGFTLDIHNPTGLIATAGGMGQNYRLIDANAGSVAVVFPSGTGAGYTRTSTPVDVALNGVTGVTVETVQQMTQGTFTTPGRGGIYNVTIDQGNGVVTGQIITGAGGTAGHAGDSASYTGFEDLDTLYPNLTLSASTSVTIAAIADTGAVVTVRSGHDSEHFKDLPA